MYFLYRTFVSNNSEIRTDVASDSRVTVSDFVFDKKNMKMIMVLVSSDRFRPFSTLNIIDV
jgi:hypothetical protein